MLMLMWSSPSRSGCADALQTSARELDVCAVPSTNQLVGGRLCARREARIIRTSINQNGGHGSGAHTSRFMLRVETRVKFARRRIFHNPSLTYRAGASSSSRSRGIPNRVG